MIFIGEGHVGHVSHLFDVFFGEFGKEGATTFFGGLLGPSFSIKNRPAKGWKTCFLLMLGSFQTMIQWLFLVPLKGAR